MCGGWGVGGGGPLPAPPCPNSRPEAVFEVLPDDVIGLGGRTDAQNVPVQNPVQVLFRRIAHMRRRAGGGGGTFH